MVVRSNGSGLNWLTACLLSALLWCQQANSVDVITSIKPIALIAQELALESDQVNYLLPAGVSPHAYSLRVSQMRQLHAADLVLWVGPELETFLQKPLAALPEGRVMTLVQLVGLQWPEDDGAAGHHADHSHEHDPHLWLNPENTLVVVDALARHLAQLNPAAAEAYAARAQSYKSSLVALDTELRAQMSPLADTGFAVYHDGYRHWVEHYGMRQVDYVTVTPEQKPGAKHLVALQERLRSDAKCLFVEPYSDVTEATRLAKTLGLGVGELDPLASASSLASYEQLLRHISASLSACLVSQN
ncbi:zinc ABC transporter substrate-binding protein [Gilvimarinus sp. SDUM040013]|uniref:High-affinity zinc uptake system protein ZnuA n=1 Tax=Gilvimarinus gilvus TaxID=3058038 RepID=A0ABU4S6J3_9GAMM|nr:zinc ABC transporter substrate-binding protein [Gilvimarinus sp. SDUM040013]MDO3388081.1 zinc ABC transporter substrate-binding protein [Gilvimarinus sp. SDUM040013]MDX6850989.1 zinc ABC transporter substrate-binding protein [Gilvimarinus sp. SDUM040013]